MKPEPSPEDLAAENQRLREALAEATARAEAFAAQIQEIEAIRRDLERNRPADPSRRGGMNAAA